MLQTKRILKHALTTVLAFTPAALHAADGVALPGLNHSAQDAGVSAIWVLANISYAGMRAHNHPSAGWRVLSFLFGFPGTLVTWFAVREGSERAYGIDVPKKKP
jgi:hypothetical protein